jgi:hypothetical protein
MKASTPPESRIANANPQPEQERADLWALSDLCTPWCVHVVATLRIAEHIAAGRDEINDLAAAAQCDAHCLQAVLRHLVGKGVFHEPAPGRFALNETAAGLLDPGQRLGLDLEDIGGRMAHAWSTLLNYVRTGAPAYHERFGLPFWDDLDAHPNLAASFDALIGPPGHGTPDPRFEITGGWESVRTLVDVGGGTGAMLAEILRIRLDIRGTLVDLPRTVARSAETFEAAGVAERVTTVGQSFFDALPPGADLYLLRGIINDWPDSEAMALLRCCAEAARPNGRVWSSEREPRRRPPQPDNRDGAGGSKHRSLTEFRELAAAAGLEVIAAGPQASGYFVVECRPI